MSEVTPTMENLTDPYVLQLIEALAKQDDEIERLQDRVAALEAVKEAAQEALECLYFHSFEPGEDPRISNLAGAMLVADGTLAATDKEVSDE